MVSFGLVTRGCNNGVDAELHTVVLELHTGLTIQSSMSAEGALSMETIGVLFM